MNNTDIKKKKVIRGVVVSNKMDKTLVVAIQDFVKIPKYKKYIKKTKRVKVHYEGKDIKEGDKVEIVSCRPISKGKKFEILVKE